MDAQWWRVYGDDAKRRFGGQMWSTNPNVGANRIRFRRYKPKNSGAGAIALAAHLGAQRVIMLGYDCQHTDGRAHWHDDHPTDLGNAGSYKRWPEQFRQLAVYLKKTEVVNASRSTALDVFKRAALRECLS